MAERSLMEQLERAVEAMLTNQPLMLAPDPELGALLEVAGDLRDMPRPEFLSRLQSELVEEGDVMSTLATKPVREGFRSNALHHSRKSSGDGGVRQASLRR
jgi:hypothetical protein